MTPRCVLLVRAPERTHDLAEGVEAVVEPDPTELAWRGGRRVDEVVFVHGSNGGKADMEAVDYGGVRNVLAALGDRPARIALMTLIGVTSRSAAYNRSTEGPDWKRRSERLVERVVGRTPSSAQDGSTTTPRASGRCCCCKATCGGQVAHDGAISRRQIAEVLVASLASDAANHKTFELVAVEGSPPDDLEPLFAALEPDPPGSLDAVRDEDNMPLSDEPERVRKDLEAVNTQEETT